MLTIIDDQICPETDSGIMALLGYDPVRYYTGRGALEALGLGFMDLGDNAVGFRINFASYNEARKALDRRTARDLSLEEQQQLVTEIRASMPWDEFRDVRCSIMGFGRHRGIVCFKSPAVALSANVSNTDPGFRKVGPFSVPNETFEPRPEPCWPLDDTEAAARTAEFVNRFVRESSRVLAQSRVNAQRQARGALPANLLLFRDSGGQVPLLEPFAKRFGRSLSVYGQVPAEQGLCKLIGARWNESSPAPGESEEDYYRTLVGLVRQDPADVVVVHVKAPDEPGHDGLPHDKVQAIERFDRVLLRQLLEGEPDDRVYIVTSDHATPCETGIHSADRVPVLVCAPNVSADTTRSFCEREAARGGLAVGRASELLSAVDRLLSGG